MSQYATKLNMNYTGSRTEKKKKRKQQVKGQGDGKQIWDPHELSGYASSTLKCTFSMQH